MYRFKAKPKLVDFVMGKLPKDRFNCVYPFANADIDYCDPFWIKKKKQRNRNKVKAYVSIFVCFLSKAIHSESVNDLITKVFIAALKRFFSYRGKSKARQRMDERSGETLEKWEEYFSDPRVNSERRVIKAIWPRLFKWVERASGEVLYCVTQIFTGHGCFGTYLYREGRARCHHCDGDEDTMQHTLKYCPAWTKERRVLVQQMGRDDISFSGIIEAMFESECGLLLSEAVMLQK